MQLSTLPSPNLSIEDFAVWLERQSDKRRFDMSTGHNCVLGLYLSEHRCNTDIRVSFGMNQGHLFKTNGTGMERVYAPWAQPFLYECFPYDQFKVAKRIFARIYGRLDENGHLVKKSFWSFLKKR